MAVSDVAQVQGGKVKTPVGDAPLIPLLLIFLGGYLAWFGVHYWRNQQTKWPSDPVKSVLQGKGVPVPVAAASTAAADIAAAGAGSGTGSAGGSATGQQIASDAQKYDGSGYTWGGIPAKGQHDCSSLVNQVIGMDLHLAIPGFKAGTYDGTTHGPDVAAWIAWGGVEHIGSTGQVQAGDLVAWPPNQHMGIAISGTDMISAENPANGTTTAAISGFSLTFPIVLRLKATLGPAPGTPGSKDAARNQATASLLASRFGWSAFQSQSQWDSLVALWDRESNWSTTAVNPDTGATGIPQLNPADHKIPANWASARVQILWGLAYIKARYGDPATAWQHEQAAGWY